MLRAVPFVLALALPLRAELHVEVTSAVAPGSCSVRVVGDPGRPWSLFFGETEAPTALSPLLVLDVDPARQLAAGTWYQGVIGPSGSSTVAFTVPAALAGRSLSFQAVSGRPSPSTSNVWRATFVPPNAFGASGYGAIAPSLLGDLFPLDGGRMLAIGGAGPLASTWEPDRQAFVANGFVPSTAALSTRVQLADGRVLVAGGLDATTQQPTADAWLYDPATSSAQSVGPMGSARAGAAGCLLPNGKAFLFGGLSLVDVANPTTLFDGILATSELFDPSTNAFAAGPSIAERKAFATATLMNNGQVLVAGGLGVAPIVNLPFVSNLAWTYNATTNAFGAFPKTFTEGRMLHAATKLSDGRVLLTGGITADLTGVLASGDLTQIAFATIATTAVYSTSGLGSFSNGPTMLEPRAFHTATALDATKTLVAGGVSGTLDVGAILAGTIALPPAIATSELLTPGQPVQAGPSMSAPRAGASALRSPVDGRVVVIGGGPIDVELYQP